MTEILFDDAIIRASKLDAHIRSTGKLFGPFHGVVVTLKDQFNVSGVDTTLGYVGRSFNPAQDDAVIVKMLRSLGAIIIAKTNLPQSIMVRTSRFRWCEVASNKKFHQWCETDNNLWGLTTHPSHKDYTPGGSTGGEAVLLASGASMLGFGTDIGGSVRIPAHMMGIYGLKPSVSTL